MPALLRQTRLFPAPFPQKGSERPDAGSPASDATLGPTCGLNADGQHDHVWDTCVPTFVSLNLPLMVGAIIISQFI